MHKNTPKKTKKYYSNLCHSTCCFISKVLKKYGGGRGIRTPARFNPPVGFQDRSLQPDLGIPPYDVVSTKTNLSRI